MMNKLKKIGKIAGSILALFIALLFIIPLIIPETIHQEITRAINKNIKGEVQFGKTRLSFFSHFPALTLDLQDFSMKGSAPFENDTLIVARKLSLGVDILSLLSQKINVNEFYLDEANIKILADSTGHANYNVFVPSSKQETSSTESNTQIKIAGIYIKGSTLFYDDASIPMQMRVKGLNYSGEGDLSNAIFDLKSKLHADEVHFLYDGVSYLEKKKLDAQLVTQINTNSLSFNFNENNLKINALPIEFTGKFSFLSDGYAMDFETKAKETDLKDIFSALPQAALKKLEDTSVDGFAEVNASLKGNYVASLQQMPSITFNLTIRDGKIKDPRVPEALDRLHMILRASVPGLNPDSAVLQLDTMSFVIGNDSFRSKTIIKGINKPYIFTNTHADIDLAKWATIAQMDSLQMRGRLKLDLQADGQVVRKVVHSGIRRIDTIIEKIPRFKLATTLKGGAFKYPHMPIPVNNVNIDVSGENADGAYSNTHLAIREFNLQASKNFIKGRAEIHTAKNTPIDLQIQSALNLSDIAKVYPLQDFVLGGQLNVDITSKGLFNKRRKLFPKTTATIRMNDGMVKTNTLNETLQKITIDADLTNTDGTLRNTKMNIRPISFEMGGQPFRLEAKVNNFEDVHYQLRSKGVLDLDNLYRLFAVEGYQVNGKIITNFALRGSQSDALARRLNRLQNTGSMQVQNLRVSTDMFPKQFLIQQGVFSFSQDKMNFNKFKARYGKSDFWMHGGIHNFINYILDDTASLHGNFQLRSRHINADEFMAYSSNKPAHVKTANSSGVIVIPRSLKIGFDATVGSIAYNGLNLKKARGAMMVDNGRLTLDSTGFEVAGAKVLMNASYADKGPRSALFSFGLSAKDFDIARMYKEVKLFREMASSASHVKGIVSLDYQLQGKLNADMYPILPSLTGEGTLGLQKVSLYGFRMMNAVSKQTEREGLKDPNLKDVKIKTSLKNNILTISPTKMRIAGFRPKFEGQVSLDGRLNLKGRLGLPPFGIFGIPLSVTGTQSAPLVKLKRNKEGKLEESKDESED